MADKKISDFTAVTSLGTGDLFELETAAGNSRKITEANLRAAMNGTMRGALVTKAADQTAANYSAGAMIAWDSEAYDTDTIHDNVTNNSRLTVPSGVTYVRLQANVYLDNVTAGSDTYVEIRKNGVITYTGVAIGTIDMPSIVAPGTNLSTPILAVTAGDYFEVKLTCADSSITVYATYSWFAMEIVA